MADKDAELVRSWERNAGNWTRVVRQGLIPSRRAGADAAILGAIIERRPSRLLDIGCGEGWLVRAVTEQTGCTGVGIDGVAALIDEARAADPVNSYFVLDYVAFAADPNIEIGGNFDVVAFNYALFAEDIAGLLKAASLRLSPAGVIVIQTLHPGNAGQGSDGWRVEDFSAFEGGEWAAMPWYSRGLESWRAAIRDAGLDLCDLREPAADGRILSLLMICGRSS